jgi:microcystin-dependent protein
MQKRLITILYCIVALVIVFIIYLYIKLNKNFIKLKQELMVASRMDDVQFEKFTQNVTEAIVEDRQKYDQIPIGTIFSYAGLTLPDETYMPCDGKALPISEYQDLFNIIGTIYTRVETDSSLYFNLPDLRSMFVRGLDLESSRLIGSYESYATAMPRKPFITDTRGLHSHVVSRSGGHVHDMTFKLAVQAGKDTPCYSTKNYNGTTSQSTDWGGEHSHSISSDGLHTHSLLGGDDETRPVNIALHYLIKVK